MSHLEHELKIVWAEKSGTEMPTQAGTLTRRYFHGERMTVAHFTFTAGTILPTHAHDNEQFTTVLSGRLRFVVGDTVVEAGPGDTVHLAPQVVHGATALEDTEVLDLFAPIRADW